MDHTEIEKRYSDIFSTYPDTHIKEHVRKLIEFDQFYPFDSTFYCITNTSNLNFEYISKNFSTCTSLSADEMLQKGMSYFWSLIHPEDIELWLSGLKELMEFTMCELTSNQKRKVTYTWNYRLKNGQGNYINIIQNTTPLQFDENDKPIIGLAHYTILDMNVKRDIVIHAKVLNAKATYETVYYKNLTNQNLIDLLSSREKDIVRELITNKTMNQIAENLFISEHTVLSHKKNVYKKLNVKTKAELVNCFKFNPDLI